MPRRPRSEGDEIRRLSADLRENPDPVTFARLAELLCNQGRPIEARAVCEQCIARYPGYMPIRTAMARVCMEEGDLERAERELRLVVSTEPHNRVGRIALARFLIQQGNLAQAKDHLEYALFLAPGDQVARQLLAQASGQRPTQARGVGSRGGAAAPSDQRPASSIDEALELVGNTEGVRAALLVDQNGFPIGTAGEVGDSADALSVVIHETWHLARTYVVRMQLGTLRLATIFGTRHTFLLLPCGPGLLAVATDRDARLGLVNLQVDAARNLLAAL